MKGSTMQATPEMIEDLRMGAVGIRRWMPEALPANEQGQVHFARALAEAAAEAIEAILPALAASPPPAVEPVAVPAIGDNHPDALAVDRFAAAMKRKLAQKRAEGRDGWEDKDQCSGEFLSHLLREHVEKGDPLDVGNLAMMLHQRGEKISPAPPASTELREENERLKAGIKRLSDEEEYCAEVTGEDPFQLVYLSAKLASTEARAATLSAENERLRVEAESMRARAEAADDEIHAIAAHLDCESDRDSVLHTIGELEADLSISKDRATALKERLQRVEGLVQRAKAILPQFYEDWHECVAAALAREGK